MEKHHCGHCALRNNYCTDYLHNDNTPCLQFTQMTDNSRFFGNFLGWDGRINRIQFLVANLIAVAIFFIWREIFFSGFDINPDYLTGDMAYIFTVIVYLPSFYIVTVAGIKRCKDSRTDLWYAFVPAAVNLIPYLPFGGFLEIAAFFYLFIQPGEDTPNRFGSIPLKPYEEQADSRLVED